MPFSIPRSRSGFSLIELMIVIVIIGILVLIAIPRINAAVDSARLAHDKANVRILNGATVTYKIGNGINSEDTFSGVSDEESRIMVLVDNSVIRESVEPKTKDASYQWDIAKQVWNLIIDNEPVMLTQFGNSFFDITEGFIEYIQEQYEENGSYGRTWGDYRFTDIGLDPEDWGLPIEHFTYRPHGGQLIVEPEEGFTPTVETISGEVKTVYTGYNLYYDIETGKWYWHSVSPENEIDINTLQLTP